MDTAIDKYRRDLGTVGIAFLVVNSLIGAGIFGLPELLHQAVGLFAPWLVLLGGILIASVVGGYLFDHWLKTGPFVFFGSISALVCIWA